MCDKITSEPSQAVPENPSPLGTQLSPEGCPWVCHCAMSAHCRPRTPRACQPLSIPHQMFQTGCTGPGGRRGQQSAPAQPIAMLNPCLANPGGKKTEVRRQVLFVLAWICSRLSSTDWGTQNRQRTTSITNSCK